MVLTFVFPTNEKTIGSNWLSRSVAKRYFLRLTHWQKETVRFCWPKNMGTFPLKCKSKPWKHITVPSMLVSIRHTSEVSKLGGKAVPRVLPSKTSGFSCGDPDQCAWSRQRVTQSSDAFVLSCVPWAILETEAPEAWITQRGRQRECPGLGQDVEM